MKFPGQGPAALLPPPPCFPCFVMSRHRACIEQGGRIGKGGTLGTKESNTASASQRRRKLGGIIALSHMYFTRMHIGASRVVPSTLRERITHRSLGGGLQLAVDGFGGSGVIGDLRGPTTGVRPQGSDQRGPYT